MDCCISYRIDDDDDGSATHCNDSLRLLSVAPFCRQITRRRCSRNWWRWSFCCCCCCRWWWLLLCRWWWWWKQLRKRNVADGCWRRLRPWGDRQLGECCSQNGSDEDLTCVRRHRLQIRGTRWMDGWMKSLTHIAPSIDVEKRQRTASSYAIFRNLFLNFYIFQVGLANGTSLWQSMWITQKSYCGSRYEPDRSDSVFKQWYNLYCNRQSLEIPCSIKGRTKRSERWAQQPDSPMAIAVIIKMGIITVIVINCHHHTIDCVNNKNNNYYYCRLLLCPICINVSMLPSKLLPKNESKRKSFVMLTIGWRRGKRWLMGACTWNIHISSVLHTSLLWRMASTFERHWHLRLSQAAVLVTGTKCYF